MPSPKIHKDEIKETFFLTFVVMNRCKIFKDSKAADFVINSFKYCQLRFELSIYGYVIMYDHIHLIGKCRNMIDFIREFKTFISKKLKLFIEKKDLLHYFMDKSNNYHFWYKNNWPVLIETDKFMKQKLDYIHQNPTRKGYVEREEDWKYSSARNYYLDDQSLIKVEIYS